MSYKLLFEAGRVQIENDGQCAIWLDEGDALLLAHDLMERLRIGDGSDGYNAGGSAPESVPECSCFARMPSECACGAWDNLDESDDGY